MNATASFHINHVNIVKKAMARDIQMEVTGVPALALL